MASSDEEGSPKPLSGDPRAQPEDSNASLPALFWDALPNNVEEHPDWVAMQALAEETPIEERAAKFKDQGNKKLQAGMQAKNRLLIREAIEFYDQGLALACGDAQVDAALHNNSAHVHLLLGNWRKALQHASQALQLEPSSLKACFRGAKAAMKLGEHDEGTRFVEAGLKLEPGAEELLKLQQDLEQQRRRTQQEREQDAARREAALQPARQLAATICSRGIQVATPEVRVGARKPYVDADGLLHWPMLLMYPETMQKDVVEDVCEDHTLDDHLDVMFGEGAPPLEWDTDQEYTRGAIELYYLAHGGTPLTQEELASCLHGEWPEGVVGSAPSPYGDQAAGWRRVDPSKSLVEVLCEPGHVVPGVPLFWVLSRSSAYLERFLEHGQH